MVREALDVLMVLRAILPRHSARETLRMLLGEAAEHNSGAPFTSSVLAQAMAMMGDESERPRREPPEPAPPVLPKYTPGDSDRYARMREDAAAIGGDPDAVVPPCIICGDDREDHVGTALYCPIETPPPATRRRRSRTLTERVMDGDAVVVNGPAVSLDRTPEHGIPGTEIDAAGYGGGMLADPSEAERMAQDIMREAD